MLRNAWTRAWGAENAPPPLPMPLQGLVTADAMRRTERYAGSGDTQAVACSPAGQVIGQITEVESCREVIYRLQQEYLDSVESLNSLSE